MASDPPYDEQFQPEPPPKRGMSSGMKVLIILLCIGGGLALLCCGGMVYFVYKNRNAMSQDAAVIKEVTKEIAEIDIPANFEPVMSMNVSMWVKIRWASYRTKNRAGNLVLGEMSVPNATEEEVRQQLRQQMSQQGQGQRELDINKTVTRTFKIRGRDVPFKFAEATDPNSKAAYRQVSGSFPGKKTGVVMLLVQLPETDYKEADVVKMIQSIK